jgi:hypothetical protein
LLADNFVSTNLCNKKIEDNPAIGPKIIECLYNPLKSGLDGGLVSIPNRINKKDKNVTKTANRSMKDNKLTLILSIVSDLIKGPKKVDIIKNELYLNSELNMSGISIMAKLLNNTKWKNIYFLLNLMLVSINSDKIKNNKNKK